MKVRKFETMEEWHVWRLGKGTGSRVKDFMLDRNGALKSEAYRMVAESIIGTAVLAEDELTSAQVLERGHVLEREALKKFAEATGKKLDSSLQGWEHPEDSRLAISPDASIGKTEAVEVKCLLSAKHVEALFTRAIPKNTAGYEEQRNHYFVVNEKLKTLHYVFYHPDFPAGMNLFWLTFKRKDLEADIAKQEAASKVALNRVREIVNALTLYSPEEVVAREQRKNELLAEAKESSKAGLERVYAEIKERS